MINNQNKHKTDVSYLYRDAFLSIIRAYIIKRRFLRFSRAAYLPSMQNTRLKTVICARRAVQNIMIICLLLCMARGRCTCLGCIVFGSCLHAPRPLFIYPYLCAVFVFSLYVWYSLFSSLLVCFHFSLFPLSSFALSLPCMPFLVPFLCYSFNFLYDICI